jgi:hypothetical protein
VIRRLLSCSSGVCAEVLAVLLLTAAVFGLFGLWWALLPAVVYLVLCSFTMGALNERTSVLLFGKRDAAIFPGGPGSCAWSVPVVVEVRM